MDRKKFDERLAHLATVHLTQGFADAIVFFFTTVNYISISAGISDFDLPVEVTFDFELLW